MNKTEMRMLRWIQGVRLSEHKVNEEIREAATVQPIAKHLRPRGRPNLRYMDTIKRDTKKNGLTDVNILDRNNLRLAVSRAAH